MPIRPENRDRYPADWVDISNRIRFGRAGGRCECDGRCGREQWHLGVDGRCEAQHGKPIRRPWPKPSGPAPVVLTTAHLDHTPENCDDANLLALCQSCHLHYDRAHHAETRRASQKDPGQSLLW